MYNAWNLSSLDTINGQNKEARRKERRGEGREEMWVYEVALGLGHLEKE